MITEEQVHSIKAYCSTKPHVVAVYLYGSQGRGTSNALSDTDLAVMLTHPKDATGDFHIDVVGAMMKIMHNNDIDVQLLTIETPPALAIRMIQGKLLYCRSLTKKAEVEAQILSRYQDFQPFLAVQFAAMEQRIKEGRYAARY